jgi:hypothetical protein
MSLRQLLKVRKPDVVVIPDVETISFDEVVSSITCLSSRAQATFMFKLTSSLDKPVLKTLLYYTKARLKHGNNTISGQKFCDSGRDDTYGTDATLNDVEHLSKMRK